MYAVKYPSQQSLLKGKTNYRAKGPGTETFQASFDGSKNEKKSVSLIDNLYIYNKISKFSFDTLMYLSPVKKCRNMFLIVFKKSL